MIECKVLLCDLECDDKSCSFSTLRLIDGNYPSKIEIQCYFIFKSSKFSTGLHTTFTAIFPANVFIGFLIFSSEPVHQRLEVI